MPKKSAAEFSYNPKTGLYRKKIKHPVTGVWTPIYGHTKAECRDKIRAREAEWKQLQQTGDDLFVFQYAARWFELNTKSVGEKRREDYRNAINNHICPIIGEKLLREVTWDDTLAVMAAAADMSKSANQKIACTMRRIFDSAEKNNLIPRSPCRDLKPGGKKAGEKVPLTKPQQTALMAAVRGTKAEAFCGLALYAGLRREEALGLAWDKVHLDSVPPYLEVRQACNWGAKNQPEITTKLKSEAARRDIPIPLQLVDILTRVKAKSKSEYVVSNDKGQPMSKQSFRRLWEVVQLRTVREVTVTEDGVKKKVMLQLGDKVKNHKVEISLDFHCTPHQLRHTYITELILSGANIKTVQYLAGHSTVTLTLQVYTHLMENTPADTVSAVVSAFGLNTGAKPTGKNTADA